MERGSIPCQRKCAPSKSALRTIENILINFTISILSVFHTEFHRVKEYRLRICQSTNFVCQLQEKPGLHIDYRFFFSLLSTVPDLI